MAGRLEATAAAIAKGQDPEAAMVAAGFGGRFAAGYARVIVGLLVSKGLLKNKPTPLPEPVDPAPEPAAKTSPRRRTVREEA